MKNKLSLTVGFGMVAVATIARANMLTRSPFQNTLPRLSDHLDRPQIKFKYRALQDAAAALDVDQVKTLLAKGAPVNLSTGSALPVSATELPPLMQTLLAANRVFSPAEKKKAEAITQILVAHGADMRQPYSINFIQSLQMPDEGHPRPTWAVGSLFSPMMMAIYSSSTQLANTFLSSLPDSALNFVNEAGQSAVSVAAFKKDHVVLKKLLARNASATVPPGNFETPLMRALDHGLVDQKATLITVRLLLEHLKVQNLELNRTFQFSPVLPNSDSETEMSIPQTALDRAINLKPALPGLSSDSDSDSDSEPDLKSQLKQKNLLIDLIIAAGGQGAPKKEWKGTFEEENTYRIRLGFGLRQPLQRRQVADAYIARLAEAQKAMAQREKVASQLWQTRQARVSADEEFNAFCDKYKLIEYRPLQDLAEANSVLQSISE